ncbi:hypothetical protein [Rhodopirellula baltica]
MRTPVLAAIAVAVFSAFGCRYQVSVSELPSVRELTQNFASASDFNGSVQQVVDHAVSRECSVMFVHLDWAMTEIYHKQYAEFVIEYCRLFPRSNLAFHFADCTTVSRDYAPLRKIPGWQQLMDDAGSALIHGHGEIVWVEKGRVLHVQKISDFKTAAQLVECTCRLTQQCE